MVWSGKQLFALNVDRGLITLSDLESPPDPARFRHAPHSDKGSGQLPDTRVRDGPWRCGALSQRAACLATARSTPLGYGRGETDS